MEDETIIASEDDDNDIGPDAGTRGTQDLDPDPPRSRTRFEELMKKVAKKPKCSQFIRHTYAGWYTPTTII